MKKLLSIIGSISIVGSGAIAAVACSNSTSNPANDVKRKIDGKSVGVTQISGKTAASAYTTEINTQLKIKVPSLSDTEIGYLSYTGTLVTGQPTRVIVTIKAGDDTDTAAIKVTLNQTDKQKANAVKVKIDNVGIITIVQIANKTVANDYKDEINTALQNTAKLSDTEIGYLSYNGILKPDSANNVIVNIKVNNVTLSTSIKVTLTQTDQQKANTIKNKINSAGVLPIPGTNGTDASKDKEAIDQALKEQVALSDVELEYLAYSGTLELNTEKTVTVTITVGSAIAKTTIKVTLQETDQQKVDEIKNKITDRNAYISNPSGSLNANDNRDVINASLQNQNGALTNLDLTKISYNGTLARNSGEFVKLIITINEASATMSIEVLCFN